MYEPMAVEARLGRDYDSEEDWGSPALRGESQGRPPADDSGQHALPPATESLTQAFREAIYGPALDNYDGWVSLALYDDNGRVAIGGDRNVTLQPDTEYQLRVVVADQQVTEVSEPLVVTGGVDRETVEFTAEVDSDQRALRQTARVIAAGPQGGDVVFTIRTPAAGFATPPWLWVRVSQQRRLIQSVELIATVQMAAG
jgi:hypothetical protein